MRRIVIILGAPAAFFAAAVLALPWWLGAAVGLVGPRFGLSIGDYERNGYARFTVRDVKVQRPGVTVTISRIESLTPMVWLWRRATGGDVTAKAGEWTTDVQRREQTTVSTRPRGWVPLRAQLVRVADILERWVPAAEVGKGVVTWPRGGLTIESAIWRERTLSSPAVSYRDWRAAVVLGLPAEGEITAVLESEENDALVRLSSEDEMVTGAATWWGQPVELEVKFEEQGWRPLAALFVADAWEIPGTRVKLEQQYASIRGNARVEWRDENLTAEVRASGTPLEGAKAPPLDVTIRGHGADGRFVAETFDVDLPGITARLSEPVEIDRTGRVYSAASDFRFEVDLERQTWIEATGRLVGAGAISANDEGRPLIAFAFSGDGLDLLETRLSHLDARGTLNWPVLRIDAARIVGARTDELAGQGAWDFRARAAQGLQVRGTVHREAFARWLPENADVEVLAIEASANGPVGEMQHEGRVEAAELKVRELTPARIVAEWRGVADRVEAFSAEARMKDTAFMARGAADRNGVDLEAIEWLRDDETVLEMATPTRIEWAARKVGPLQLRGPDARAEMALEWGDAGKIDLTLAGFRSEWLRDLAEMPRVEWTVEALTFRGQWDRGPLSYDIDTNVRLALDEQRDAYFSAQFAGNADGLQLELLRVSEGEGVVVNAAGTLPIVVNPSQRPVVVFDENARFRLDAATSPNPAFWEKFTQLTGLELANPAAVVHFEGTWAHPQGEARLEAERLEAVSGRFKDVWPKIEDLNAHLTGDRDGVKLEHFSLEVNGQAVRAEGWLPVTASSWREFFRDPRQIARRGDLRVQVPNADLAAVAQHFPGVLAPKGRVHLDVTLKPDATVNGFLRISEATSRPLGPLGVLQEVNADVRFEGRTMTLAGVTARMAGRTVRLQGTAELPDGEPVKLNLTLQGENLPFVRKTGLLLRGDLDLKLVTAANGTTTIGGRVGLRDSLFLADLRSFLPTGAKGGPAARPPYFSVDVEPVNAWRLDVVVEGDRFMQLRTPVFNGVASADFKLAGTLANPRASGEAVIEEGNVRLPFANFSVRQGYVRVSAEQPDPQIFVTGTTRRYGYDVRMELSGAVNAPNLTFSSSPPLEAEQVLLMVMAGQAPNDEITTTGRQRATRFGAFFGQSLLGTLGGDASGADRLTISSGEDISAQGRETYNIEYRLNDTWALTGEYDEFDEYYGGVKWRIYSKGGGKDARK